MPGSYPVLFMRKFFYGVTIIAGIVFGIYAANFIKLSSQSPVLPASNVRVIHSPTPTSKVETVYYRPVTLRLPKLGIETHIEEVGQDEKGNMDVPKKAENVGWYRLGVKPGEKGNAVIAGHLDTQTGAPAIFYKLSTLEPGDTVEIVDVYNNTLVFTVQKKVAYPTDEFPLQKVFGPSSEKMLNLITCDGTFNQSRKLYSQRLVIFSKLNPL